MVQVPSVNLGGHQKCPYEESPTIEKYLNIRPNLTRPNLTLSIQSYVVYTLCLWQAVRTTLGPIFNAKDFSHGATFLISFKTNLRKLLLRYFLLKCKITLNIKKFEPEWLSYLLLDPAAPGLIPSVPQKISEEKNVDVAEPTELLRGKRTVT